VARRNRLLAMRRDGVIGDEAFHRIEEELDLAELALTGRRGSLPKQKPKNGSGPNKQMDVRDDLKRCLRERLV
jgi:hypothetical protein